MKVTSFLYDASYAPSAPIAQITISAKTEIEVNVLGLFPIKFETEVTVTVHRVVRCTNFVADSDSHLDRLKRNNSNIYERAAQEGTQSMCKKCTFLAR